MDSPHVTDALVAYHFATATEQERDRVDAHLLECTACLDTYLKLKRASERAPVEKPSARVKARLRARMVDMYAGPHARAARTASARGLLLRKIPLYQGFLAAAAAAALTLLLPRAQSTRPVPQPSPTTETVREGIPEVDTARVQAESLRIY